MSSVTAIDDRDSAVSYTGIWVDGGTEHEHDGTVTSSTNVGDSFTVTFTGTSITVYGTHDATSSGVQTSYAIDGGKPHTETSSNSATDSYQQVFWKSGTLSQETHTLLVTMVKINSNAGEGEGTVWFDYFNVDGAAVSSTSSSTASSTSVTSSASPTSSAASTGATAHKGKNIGAIVGGTVAAVFILVSISILLLWARKRKRRNAAPNLDPFFDDIGSSAPQPSNFGDNFPTPMANASEQPYSPIGHLAAAPTIHRTKGPVSPISPTMSTSSASLGGREPLYIHNDTRVLSYDSAGASTVTGADSIAALKQLQRAAVANHGETLRAGSISRPVTQHVDSGLRTLDTELTEAIELPPTYSAT